MSDPTDASSIPPIRGNEVWRLAATENRRFVDLVRSLVDDDWPKPTDCDRWDVRALCLHMLGAMHMQASPPELVHQFRRGLPLNKTMPHDHWVDGINELQIRERSNLSPHELVSGIEHYAPKAVAGRRRVPPPFRWLPIPMGPPIGWKPLTYLLRVGFTRDVWMHRIDLARAAGREIVLSADHDGRIVADLLAEWTRIHRRPCILRLEGPAGGAFRYGDGVEELTIDAVDFCRILSGRGTGTGLLALKLPL